MAMVMFMKSLVILLTASLVKSEGYYCPYDDLGANGDLSLLYDYYNANGGYWTRMGQVGWTSVQAYCADKGDSSKHSDAGEWKCNDSKGLCMWSGSECLVAVGRAPDCRELCQAILNNQGPECLGDCPAGKMSNNMYDLCNNSQEPTPQPMETTQTTPTPTVRARVCYTTVCSKKCKTQLK
jgi:hypothetical protein